MFNLIASELFKIGKSKVTYVIGSVFAFMALVQIVAYASMASMEEMIGQITGIRGMMTPLEGDLSYIIISIFVTIIVCQDFATGSIRQIIGKGCSKIKYVFAKYIAMVLVIVVFMASYSLIDFVGFSAIGSVGDFNSESIKQIMIFGLGAFSMILGYAAIIEFICILFKKNTIAIPLSLLFTFVGGMVAQLIFYFTENEKIFQYWLSNMSASFCVFEVEISQKMIYIAIFLVIAIVFSALSAFIFHKKDIE